MTRVEAEIKRFRRVPKSRVAVSNDGSAVELRFLIAGAGLEDASKEKHRIHLAEIGAGHSLTGYDQIPAALKDLVDRSLRLHERIQKLDEMLSAKARLAPPQPNPVSHQMDRLAAVFKMARR